MVHLRVHFPVWCSKQCPKPILVMLTHNSLSFTQDVVRFCSECGNKIEVSVSLTTKAEQKH